MKDLLKIIIWIVGFLVSGYFALYVMFIGGIVDIISQVKAPNTDAHIVAWGVAKLVFATLSFWLGLLITRLVTLLANLDD